MSKIVNVTVLREHTGDSGHHPEKSEYLTSLEHARQLRAQKLVDFDESTAVEEDPVQTNSPSPVSGLKSEGAPKNKAEPAPANKAEPKTRHKVEPATTGKVVPALENKASS